MEKRKLEFELKEGEEIIEREVKKFGNSGHVIVPEKYVGNKAKIICGAKT